MLYWYGTYKEASRPYIITLNMSEGEDYSVDEFDDDVGSAEIDGILGRFDSKPPSSIIIPVATPEKENTCKTPTKAAICTPPKPLQPKIVDVNYTPSKRLLKLAEPREPAYTMPITTPKPKKIRKNELDTFLQRMDAAEQRRKQTIEKHQKEQVQDIIREAQCTTKANTARRKQTTNDACTATSTCKAGQDQIQSFLQRQEAAERAKEEKRKRRAQEALYEASSGKKHCRHCGQCQSYTELLNGNDICSNDECKGKYKYEIPVAFKVKVFQERMERSTRRREQTVNRIKEEQASTLQVCSKSRRQKQLLAKVDAKGKDFLARMNDDIAKRRDKTNRLEETLRDHEAKTCNFKPKLNISKNSLKARSAEQSSSESSRRGVVVEPEKKKMEKKTTYKFRTSNAHTTRVDTITSNKPVKSRNIDERRKATYNTIMAGTSEKLKLSHFR